MLSRVSTRGVLLGLLLASTVLGAPAFALQPSGNAVRVDPAVNANGAGGERLLQLEGAVFVGDEIVASPNGLAQIKFIDDTRLVIGPNSRLKIDTFVFNPNNTAKKVTISALRGTFRFISGNSPHEAYTIRTPSMTIGVRGTIVDINVGQVDSSAVFQKGSGSICGAGGCVDVKHVCEIWVAPRGGGAVSESTGVDRQRRLSAAFPFLNDQSRLAVDFRVDTTDCGIADIRSFGAPYEGGDQKPGDRPSPSSTPTGDDSPPGDDDDNCNYGGRGGDDDNGDDA